MKKNILRILMSLLFLIAAEAQAQDWWNAGTCCCGENCSCNEFSHCGDECCCCYDEANYYVKVFSGANFLQNTEINGNNASYNTGYIIAGSLGYCWCYGLRLEGEYAYRRNTISKIDFFTEGSSKHGHFQTSSYMANLLWDVPLSSWGCALWNIQPYVGAGIGYDNQQMHASNSRVEFSQKWNRFSWQAMAGFAFPIFCDTELSLEYKYHQGGCHFFNHTLGVGLTYRFGL